jgi:hypothetical protein
MSGVVLGRGGGRSYTNTNTNTNSDTNSNTKTNTYTNTKTTTYTFTNINNKSKGVIGWNGWNLLLPPDLKKKDWSRKYIGWEEELFKNSRNQ